jgi:hypothetical protein
MPGMVYLHADQFGAGRQVGNAIRRAGEIGWLTDSNVASLTTTAGLEALVTAGGGHAENFPLRARVNQQIDIGIADGTMTNTTVAAANTVAAQAALSQYDPNRTYGSVE